MSSPAKPGKELLDPRRYRDNLRRLREDMHPYCIVCGSFNLRGLHLESQAMPDGSVQATFDCHRVLEGYEGILHGGVIASLLDGAMTHCLFANGHVGVTAVLNVRFHHPVEAERAVTVRARITESCHTLHHLAADLIQDGQIRADATAKFLETPKSREV